MRKPESAAEQIDAAWTINRNVDSPDRPSFVLQVIHHRPSIADLTDDEVEQLGRLLRPLTEAVRATTGAEHVQVLYINEGKTPHVHLHLVPRFAGESAQVGIAEPVPQDERPALAVTAAAVAALVRADLGRDRRFGAVVAARRAADLIQSLLPYGAIRERWQGRDRKGDFAPRYVGAWLVVLIALVAAAANLPAAVGWVCVALGTARVLDIASYEVLILLGHDPTRTLWGYERSLVLLAMNLGELVLAEAIVLRVAEGARVGTSLMEGFGLVGLFGLPTTTTTAAAILTVVVASAALVLIAGGLSLVVGLIGGEFKRKRA